MFVFCQQIIWNVLSKLLFNLLSITFTEMYCPTFYGKYTVASIVFSLYACLNWICFTVTEMSASTEL